MKRKKYVKVCRRGHGRWRKGGEERVVLVENGKVVLVVGDEGRQRVDTVTEANEGLGLLRTDEGVGGSRKCGAEVLVTAMVRP
jgi:hypothetical protein